MMKKMSKTYAGGGKIKTKGMRAGGKSEDKLKMVEKDGKMVPFFAADGEGKMKAGGMTPNTKGYFKGGKTLTQQASESVVMPRGQTQRALDSGAMNPSGGEVMPGRSQGGYRPPKPKRPRRGRGPRG
jgi:hypothetical protein